MVYHYESEARKAVGSNRAWYDNAISSGPMADLREAVAGFRMGGKETAAT